MELIAPEKEPEIKEVKARVVHPPGLLQRVYVNGFPKAGTHLAELYVHHLAAPVVNAPWLGSFEHNAWSVDWFEELDRFFHLAGNWPGGGYLKGHCGYREDLERALWDGRVCKFFAFRDLRAVSVSAAYHILDGRKNPDGTYAMKHPGRDDFLKLDTMDDVIVGVIEGLNEWPGVIERWSYYEPWLDRDWVCKLRFQDMIQDKERVADIVMRYVIGLTGTFWETQFSMTREKYDALLYKMVDSVDRLDTATKRKGTVDGWRSDWNGKIQEAWERAGGPVANARITGV